MDKTAKKSLIAFRIIAVLNFAIIILAFCIPNLALRLSIALIISIFLLLVGILRLSTILGIKYLDKLQKKSNEIEDDSEREAQQIKNAVHVIVTIFIWCVYIHIAFVAWGRRLFGLLLTSLLSLIAASLLNFFALGLNTHVFIVVVIIYIFLRVFVRFTINPLCEKNKSNEVPHWIKLVLEAIRIVFLLVAALGRDGLLGDAMVRVADAILGGVVATIAIDSIMVTVEKIVAKKDVSQK